MGFTKLDSNLIQSSIMMESPEVFKIWITLLAACEEDGVAKVSPVFLSSVCRLHIDDVQKALKKLMEPDQYSRSTEDKGKRIRRVNGGFFIVNYQKYRSYTYSRSKEATKKRRQRGTQRGHVPSMSPCDVKGGHKGDMSPTPGDISSSASSSSSSSSPEGTSSMQNWTTEALWSAFKVTYTQNGSAGAKPIATQLWRKVEEGHDPERILRGARAYAEYSHARNGHNRGGMQADNWIAKEAWLTDWNSKRETECPKHEEPEKVTYFDPVRYREQRLARQRKREEEEERREQAEVAES